MPSRNTKAKKKVTVRISMARATKPAGSKMFKDELKVRTAQFRTVAFGRTKNTIADVVSDIANQYTDDFFLVNTPLTLETIHNVKDNKVTRTGRPYSPSTRTIEYICRATGTRFTAS